MYKDIFLQLGLNNNEAIIYEYLLAKGESPASHIIKKTPLKKGVIYNALASLEQKGLIYTKIKEKISYFGLNHPDKLQEFVEERENELQKIEKNLSSNMPKIISRFNLVSGQPGIRIYEGKEGIVKVLNDSLTTKTEILTYADIEGIEKYLGKENDKYVRRRAEKSIKKRGIVADTPYARQYLKDYDQSVTEIRLIDGKKFPMFLEMEIYDNKVSFMTFSEKKIIGLILENEEIYKTQRSIFNLVWNEAKPLKKIIEIKPSRFEVPSPEAK